MTSPQAPFLFEDMSTDEFITIVTGLPRSGTSMMMQMLQAGGIPILTDSQREADEDNPRGYLEFAKTKGLREDNAWLLDAKGMAVKVIAHLLEYLPTADYRFILMQRDMQEIIRSQRVMLSRSSKQGARLTDAQLLEVFRRKLLDVEKSLQESHMPWLNVSYSACTENPGATAAEVNRFLGGHCDEQAMAEVVDASLYRQRG